MNREFPDVQAGFRNGRGSRDQIANICWIIEKAREFQKKKTSTSALWLCQSLWLCGSQQTVENSSRDGNTKTTWPASWEMCTQVRKQQLELDMELLHKSVLWETKNHTWRIGEPGLLCQWAQRCERFKLWAPNNGGYRICIRGQAWFSRFVGLQGLGWLQRAGQKWVR